MSLEIKYRNKTIVTSNQYPMLHTPYRATEITKGVVYSALAVVTAFIPVAHFVLVPLFLVLAVTAFSRLKEYLTYSETIQFKCQKCPQSIELNSGKKLKPLEECPSCKATYEISYSLQANQM